MCFYRLPHWDISVIPHGYICGISMLKRLDDGTTFSNLSLNFWIVNSFIGHLVILYINELDVNYF